MRVIGSIAIAVGLALPFAAALSPAVAQGSFPVTGRVLWLEEDRAWLLLRDSMAVAPGMRVTLIDRRDAASAGIVTSVSEGRVASVRLEDRRLSGVKRLDRLRIEAEPRVEVAPAMLRVGLPDGARENLAVPCRAGSLGVQGLADRYRLEPLPGGEMLGVRMVAAPGLPETLLVRRFGDAVDEEIALERGEIDVAVFWPGEPSARARRARAPGEVLHGLRARGALALSTGGSATGIAEAAAGDSTLASLAATLFAGDLAPWAGLAPSLPAAGPLPASRGFAVDPGVPGHRTIEHFLNGGAALFQRRKAGPLVLRYVDIPLPSPGGDAALSGSDLPTPASGSTEAPIFALACPILCAPGTVRAAEAIGPGVLANLPGCEAGPEPR